MSETSKRIDALTEKIHENHLEAMTAITRQGTQIEYIISRMEENAGKPKRKPWYTSKLAQGIGGLLAAIGTIAAFLFRK